jgi:hypothetical protein
MKRPRKDEESDDEVIGGLDNRTVLSSLGLMEEPEQITRSSKPKKKKKHVNFQELGKLEAEDEHYQDEEIECRACRVGGYFTGEWETDFASKMALLIKNHSHSMNREALISEIYDLGQKERAYILKKEKVDLGEWTKEQIEYHLFNCMTDLSIWMIGESRDLRLLMKRLKNRLFEVDEEEIVANEKNIKLYFLAQNQYKQLLTTPHEKANTFNEMLTKRKT